MNPLEKAFAKSIQNFLNFPEQRFLIEEFYGEGSSIKVSRVVLSGDLKKSQVTSKVVLGKTITESCIDKSMANYLIGQCLGYLNPDSEFQIFVSFDS